MNRLQNLADRLAIVIGRPARKARLFNGLECLAIVAGARVESAVVKRRGGGRLRRRGIMTDRDLISIRRRHVTDIQGFLNGRKRYLGGVFDLFGIVRHVQPTPLFHASGKSRDRRPHIWTPVLQCLARCEREAVGAARLVRYFRKHPIGLAVRMKWLLLIQS